MKNHVQNVGVFIITLLLLSSCVTSKNLTYLKYADLPDGANLAVQDLRISVTPTTYKVMVQDVLYIRVITPDPQWSALFNTTQVGQGGAITQESASLVGYPVDDNGEIDIPYVGKISVVGKTLGEIKNLLDSVFTDYVDDAAISVRLVNNYISIIGEVRAPGRYPINKDRYSIFEALSVAGDMEIFGNRHKIQLIRPSVYGPIVKEFTISDRTILNSEYYYVMPNDVLYIPPVKGKVFQNNASVYSLVLTTITTALVIIGFFR